MNQTIKLNVGEDMAGVRLDRFLSLNMPGISRSYIQKLIEDRQVLVDGKKSKASAGMKCGMEVELCIPEAEEPEIVPENIPLDIIYEDADLIVVNKPKGMVVHPGAGHLSGTLVNALLYHCAGGLSGINGVMRPGIVHRIDKDTTGLLVACKNDAAHAGLAEQFKVHSITRRYQAVVWGNFNSDDGTVDKNIGRHPVDRKKMAVVSTGGRRAVTHYHVLERFGAATHIECSLETGRTHQIRVHMSSIGHPVMGDAVYGRLKEKTPVHLEGQTLHAGVLGFVHPSTGEYMEFEAPLPGYFSELLTGLRQ